jgi:hypothetical protein
MPPLSAEKSIAGLGPHPKVRMGEHPPIPPYQGGKKRGVGRREFLPVAGMLTVSSPGPEVQVCSFAP